MARHSPPQPHPDEVLETVNLKEGLPTVDEARSELNAAISRAKDSGAAVLKVIHGYGSSGVGGALKRGVHTSLGRRQKEGRIRGWVPGESWELFDERARAILAAAPGADRDADLGRCNLGISVILL